MCELLDDTTCIELPDLSSNQEEADTKVCLHAINASNEDPNKHVIIRSHSGDVNINVLLTSLIIDSVDRVFFDDKGAVPDQIAREPRGEHLPSSSLL